MGLIDDMTPADAPTRKLPIGLQTFRDVRERGCYYVDKTEPDPSARG